MNLRRPSNLQFRTSGETVLVLGRAPWCSTQNLFTESLLSKEREQSARENRSCSCCWKPAIVCHTRKWKAAQTKSCPYSQSQRERLM